MAAALHAGGGQGAPSASASAMLVMPATRPLVPAMNSGSLAETLRVRLLSSAQHAQAPITDSAPMRLVRPVPVVGHASTTPPATMSAMPSTMRRSAFSRNTIHARSAVSTASRFSSSEASAALVRVRPYISRTGPTTPPAMIAPRSHGRSAFERLAGSKPASRIKRTIQRPIPLPAYSSPATSTGGSAPTSAFAKGVLAPNSSAAASAATIDVSTVIEARTPVSRFMDRGRTTMETKKLLILQPLGVAVIGPGGTILVAQAPVRVSSMRNRPPPSGTSRSGAGMALTPRVFADRAAAGAALAREIQQRRLAPPVLVLALPRGGVPVASEVAAALDAPLDVMLVRKVGMPGQPELAIGAVAAGDIVVHDRTIEREIPGIAEAFERIAAEERRELLRREQVYRAGLAPLVLTGKTVVLVDDGLATGSTMLAAVRAARRRRGVPAAGAAPP